MNAVDRASLALPESIFQDRDAAHLWKLSVTVLTHGGALVFFNLLIFSDGATEVKVHR